MIHYDKLQDIKARRQRVSFIYPDYGRYSIAEIPNTILRYFQVDPGRPVLPLPLPADFRHTPKVLFFLIDGFGFEHFKDYYETLPFFGRAVYFADIYPLTSVFPSTTPAALTTLHTGLTPQEHGLPEWTVYFEEFNKVIETFPFKPYLTPERETLLRMGGKPEMLYDGPTVYDRLGSQGIPSYVFIDHRYSRTSYSSVTHRGSREIAYLNPDDLFTRLLALLRETPGPAYFFVYWHVVDSTGHIYGPRSQEYFSALAEISTLLDTKLCRVLDTGTAETVWLVLSADHGQTGIRGEDIIFLNNYLALQSNYLWGPSLNAIYPTGAPHDVFLYIYPPKIAETLAGLKREFGDKAEILTIKEAVDRGLFGLNQPTSRFLKRVGDILILPFEGYHIWYRHDPSVAYGQRGTHGGLSQKEMVVPFISAKLSDLLI